MTKKYYLDACIWIDYFENRSDMFRPLGEWAFGLIKKIVGEKNHVMLSNLLIKEFPKRYSEEKIKDMLQIVPAPFRIVVKVTLVDFSFARRFCRAHNIHFSDALHAAVAKNHKAILVSRDKHFELLSSYLELAKPEDLI